MWGFYNRISIRSSLLTVFVLSLFTFPFLINPANSQNIYEWTDEKGVKHYSNTEAGVPEKYRKDSNSLEFDKDYNIGNQPEYKDYQDSSGVINTFRGSGEVYKIPFKAYEGSARRIIVPVRINNAVTAELALDTGSPGMVISEGLAKRLGLYENDSGLLLSVASGIGGQVNVMRTIIDKVAIGGATENFVPTVITSSMSKAFEGLIGMDFMGNYSISIDNVNNFIVLQPNPGSTNLPAGHSENWWRRSFAEFRIYKQEWEKISELLDEMERKSRINFNMTETDFKKLQELAVWQHTESSKLLQRLERYAQQNNVPQNWRN
ncbi:MAG: DUF4124 domain-containing protein [Candidatus Dadabacteria bacterium]|nr:DUF4124 domain-containing protein [Candidatus Dadabacteria bacterium]NIS08397.1 DUF4124 domain-containing protein [Candidatus Dadabacteria bacterium]NIY21900.1 DUF4124 domain-containing protein [Candidatus Dadabacteria bacterium]